MDKPPAVDSNPSTASAQAEAHCQQQGLKHTSTTAEAEAVVVCAAPGACEGGVRHTPCLDEKPQQPRSRPPESFFKTSAPDAVENTRASSGSSATSIRRRRKPSRRATSLSGINDDELADDDFVEARLSRNFSAWRLSSIHYLAKVPKKLAHGAVAVGPSVKDAVTAAVSPRLAGRIRHAFLLAAIILAFTIGTVIGLVYLLRSQCFSNCQSTPISDLVSLVDPVCKPFSSQTFAPALSMSTQFDPFAQSLAAFVPAQVKAWLQIQGFFTYVPAPIGWFSKCAVYSENCAAVEKAMWLYGMVALRRRAHAMGADRQDQPPPTGPPPAGSPTNASTSPPPAANSPGAGSRRLRQAAASPAASPAAAAPAAPSSVEDQMLANQSSIEDLWASGKILPASLNHVNDADSGDIGLSFSTASFLQNAQIDQAPQYFTNATFNNTLFFNSSIVVKTMKAPPGAACCDVTLERNQDVPSRFAMTVQSSNSPTWPTSSCPTTEGRCTSTAVVVTVDFRCWDDSETTDYDDNPCDARSSLYFHIFFNQFIGPVEPWAVPPDPDSQVAVILSSSAMYNSSKQGGWAAYGPNVEAIYASDGIEVAAWTALLPMAYSAGVAYGTFMVAGMMTADVMKDSPLTSWFPNGDGWVIGWWNQVTIYCCSDQCPSLLSSIGAALGYASYVEMGIAFLFIGLYMIIFPDQRGGFGELISMVVRDPRPGEGCQHTAMDADGDDRSTLHRPMDQAVLPAQGQARRAAAASAPHKPAAGFVPSIALGLRHEDSASTGRQGTTVAAVAAAALPGLFRRNPVSETREQLPT